MISTSRSILEFKFNNFFIETQYFSMKNITKWHYTLLHKRVYSSDRNDVNRLGDSQGENNL